VADPASDPRVGLVLQGRYRLEERLGAGGMGVVYLAERIGLGRRVAVKFLHADIAAQPQFLLRFEREARAMSRLNHPHCVPVIDFGVVDGAPYLVMEFVAGESLTMVLARGPMPLRRALTIMRQILAGLAHAHNEGIVHRDIKPDNVLLGEATGTGDHARVFDFGLAKVTKRAGTASGLLGATAIGTPSYMSPEQARGEDVDARSDLYSCGVVLFQMLTGHKPFTGIDPLDVMRKHVEDPPPRLVDLAPALSPPPPLEAAIARALAKDAEARHASAIDFSSELQRVLDLPELAEEPPAPAPAVEPAEAGPTLAVEPRPTPRSGLWSAVFWLLVVIVIGVVGAGVWYFQRDLDQPPALPQAEP
jgi:eukaryotic-like serine/threonine-protein kinase